MRGKYKKYDRGGRPSRREVKDAREMLIDAYGGRDNMDTWYEKAAKRLKEGNWHYDVDCGGGGCTNHFNSEKMGSLPLPLKMLLGTAHFAGQEAMDLYNPLSPKNFTKYYRAKIYKSQKDNSFDAVNFRRDARKLAELQDMQKQYEENMGMGEPIYLGEQQLDPRYQKQYDINRIAIDNLLDTYKRIGERKTKN